jgi:hypothetical protein
LSSQRGQASVEWIAVVAVVAVVFLGAVVAFAPGAGSAVPRAVEASFARAFCLVSGGDCLDGAPRPCVVAADEESHERQATLIVARGADGRRFVLEERSDGTFAITVEDTARGGGGISPGLKVAVGRKGVRASAELFGDLRGGTGRRFVVPDRAAAERLMERLRAERSGARRIVSGAGEGEPVPDERWWSFGRGGDTEAALSALGLEASARVLSTAAVRVVERPVTGERTVVLGLDRRITAALTVPLARAGLGTASSVSLELGFDARGVPASLTVRGARGVDGEVSVAGRRSAGGDRVEAEARLDLADPVARGLVHDLLGGVRSAAPGRALGAARALAARLAERARIDVRLLATDRSVDVHGGSVTLGLAQLGYEVEDVRQTSRLVDAAGREPGMGWARRLDCVGVA